MKKFETIIQNLLLFTLLISILVSFFLIFHYNKPELDLLDKSYGEKMEVLRPEESEVLNFINNTVEEGSNVLFFDDYYFLIGQPYLHPKINSLYFEYANCENDSILFNFLKERDVNYIIIIDGPLQLSSYKFLFLKIELDSTTYLLKIKN